jgi:hypothetical protein
MAGLTPGHFIFQAKLLPVCSHHRFTNPKGRYCPHARKASSKARVPGVPFSMARIARLPLV